MLLYEDLISIWLNSNFEESEKEIEDFVTHTEARMIS